jgi:hypothetical protein
MTAIKVVQGNANDKGLNHCCRREERMAHSECNAPSAVFAILAADNVVFLMLLSHSNNFQRPRGGVFLASHSWELYQ